MYKFKEDQLIHELKEYIDLTYSQHYAQEQLQAMEIIIDGGHGVGFTIGSNTKYLKRYKKKGDDPETWRRDLLKNLHYSLLLLYIHDKEFNNG